MIRHWLFDLDDTLYSASTEFFTHVSERITVRIADHLSISHDDARLLKRRYWKQYGTSLRGMIVHHDMDPEPFLRYVHDVAIEDNLKPDAAVRAMLQRCGPGPRHVFTNSPAEYARRVLRALNLEDLFVNVFDIRHSEFIPKPDQHAYNRVLSALGCEARDCILIDDAPQNLVAARACGMRTVWLHTLASEAGQALAGGMQLTDEASPADVVIRRLIDLEAALASQPG
jgi:putative hydrolase of the HAD superfamily